MGTGTSEEGSEKNSTSYLTQPQVRQYLLQSLDWTGVLWKDPGTLQRGRHRYLAALAQGFVHIPFFLPLDFGTLLEQGNEARFSSESDWEKWSPEIRAIRLRYEREILGRILRAPRVPELLEALRFAPERQGPLDYAVERLIESFAPSMPTIVQLTPGQARKGFQELGALESLSSSLPEVVEESLEAWDGAGLLLEFLNRCQENIRWKHLFSEDLLFVVEHWSALKSEWQRIGCRQLLEFREDLSGGQTFRAPPQEQAGVESTLEQVSAYPAGGLDELSHKGSLENLVWSQLAFAERGPEINLFDLRYVEGELLYYHRDQGALLRRRRTLRFVFDLEDAFFLKPAQAPAQVGVLLMAFTLALYEELETLFEGDSVQASFFWLAPAEQHSALGRELQLVEVILAEALAQDRVTLQLLTEPQQIVWVEPGRQVEAIIFSWSRPSFWEQELLTLNSGTQPFQSQIIAVGPSEWTTEPEPGRHMARLHMKSLQKLKTQVLAACLNLEASEESSHR